MTEDTMIHFPDMPEAFPLGTDSVMLADFVRLRKNERVCDLGAGAGTLGLLLAARYPDAVFCGIELQPASAAAAEAAIAMNEMEGRVSVTLGDIRTVEQFFARSSFDAVVSNPPYFPVGSGAACADNARNIARSEQFCPPASLFAAAAYLLRFGGRFSFVHRPERLSELIVLLSGRQLEPKRLRLIKQTADREPTLFLLEAVKGARPGIQILPDLLLREGNDYSAEYRRIYHIGGSKT